MAFDSDNMEIYKAGKPELPPGHYSTNADKFDGVGAQEPSIISQRAIEIAQAQAREAAFALNAKSAEERTPEEIERVEALRATAAEMVADADSRL